MNHTPNQPEPPEPARIRQLRLLVTLLTVTLTLGMITITGLLALLFLLAAGGLWLFLKGDDAAPPAEVVEAVPEAPVREQFASHKFSAGLLIEIRMGTSP